MPASKFFKNIRDKSKAGLDVIKSIGHSKSTSSSSRALSACGSIVAFTDPAVSPLGGVSTGATQANSINPTASPSASATSSALGPTIRVPNPAILTPPVASPLETLDLEQPGTQDPGESSNSGRQLLVIVPQISISEPEQDNGKWPWEIQYMCLSKIDRANLQVAGCISDKIAMTPIDAVLLLGSTPESIPLDQPGVVGDKCVASAELVSEASTIPPSNKLLV